MRLKDILGIDFDNYESIKDKGINLRKPLVIHPDMNLLDLLKEFRKGKSHMAFITEKADEFKDMIGLDDNNSEIGGMRVSGQFNKCEQTSESCIDVLGNYIINKITI